ncbi:MAG: hypothetical protein IJU23_07565 [Proteobacteria bacterium]|nr:hypothetical protein [Pseudomonadota bacterium]
MKYLAWAYFIILFAIMGSYLVYSLPDNTQRLHVATADRLSETQHNVAAVWARDLETGSQFAGYSLESRWVDKDGGQIGDSEHMKLPVNGEAIMRMPPFPAGLTAGLEIVLFDDKGKIRKSAIVPTGTFNSERPLVVGEFREAGKHFFRSIAPAAFVFDHPNDVYFAIFNDGEPWRGKASIEQTYGQKASFPETVSVNGVGRFKLTLSAPVDLKISAGNAEYYASFVPSEKPIHAVLLDVPNLRPDYRPIFKVTPVGSMTDITIDYFDGDAWIGRQVIPASANGRAELDLDYVFQDNPSILYARVSASSVGTADSSQTLPIVASAKKLPDVLQADYAVGMMHAYPEYASEAALLEGLLKTNPEKVAFVRDYALALLALKHSPSIEMRVRTEKADAVRFEREKADQKSVMNVILVVWFGIGTLVCLIFVVINALERRRRWNALLASGSAEAGAIPEQTSGVMLLCLFFLLLGFMFSLFFVMQII